MGLKVSPQKEVHKCTTLNKDNCSSVVTPPPDGRRELPDDIELLSTIAMKTDSGLLKPSLDSQFPLKSRLVYRTFLGECTQCEIQRPNCNWRSSIHKCSCRASLEVYFCIDYWTKINGLIGRGVRWGNPMHSC